MAKHFDNMIDAMHMPNLNGMCLFPNTRDITCYSASGSITYYFASGGSSVLDYAIAHMDRIPLISDFKMGKKLPKSYHVQLWITLVKVLHIDDISGDVTVAAPYYIMKFWPSKRTCIDAILAVGEMVL